MVVKMRRRWSPWPPAAATRKFQVSVRPMKLDGLPADDGGDPETTNKYVAIKIKWKGEPKLFPLMAARSKKELSDEKFLKKGSGIIQWDEDHWFENNCCFSIVSDQMFAAWEIAFNVIYGDKMDSKAKMVVIGRVSMNISEIASKMEKSSLEQKLPLTLQINGFAKEATLTVALNFVEIRDPQDSVTLTRAGSAILSSKEYKENLKARRRSPSQEEVSLDDSDESGTSDIAKETSLASKTKLLDADKKEGWFSWKSRRFSFKRAKTKEEEKTDSCSDQNTTENVVSSSVHEPALQKDDPTKPSSESDNQDNAPGSWEEKELISRDGQAMLKAQVFFASFDQRSDKAAGESACTALVAVISHWLHSNSPAIPDRPQLDNLIIQGSSEWRRLCDDSTYVTDFPNKHFDLETIIRANVRPVTISHNKSFVGFFGPESFESLKGAMSFDDIWDEISCNDMVPRIYIVSWNDHFFVLKAETDAYYIIDTLGERLFEGCHQAYILRFDENTLMRKQKSSKEKAEASSENENSSKEEEVEEEDEVICSGKECCREFIKRFLAAIPLKELEEEEKKKAVSYFSLHHRLQIEFNYSCCTSSPPSSSTSSPLSSLVNSTPSTFSE